jgi:hypothetical protein
MSEQTDTPKYIGVVDTPENMHDPDTALVARAGNEFPGLERGMMEAFAESRDEWGPDGDPFPGMSEIYVRSREVQKLVRAVDAVVAARRKLLDGPPFTIDTNLIEFSEFLDQLDEARAALADIK